MKDASMHKVSLWLWLFTCTLFGQSNPLILSQTIGHTDTTAYVRYIEDINRNLTHEILYSRSDLPLIPLKHINIGSHRYDVWSRLDIVNPHERQTLVFENPRAEIDIIDVYVYKNGRLHRSFTLGDNRPIQNRSFASLKSNFALDIEAGESITLITRVSNPFSVVVGWDLYDLPTFMRSENIHVGILGIFLGLILIFIYYSMMVYRVSKRSFFLSFIFFLLTILLLQLQAQGGIYLLTNLLFEEINFELYNINTYLSVVLFKIGWFVLIIDFFDLKTRSRRWRGVFYGLIGIYTSYFFIFLVSHFWIDLFEIRMSIIRLTPVLNLILLLFFIVMIRQKVFGSIYFLLATISTNISFMYSVVTLIEHNDITFITKYRVLFGAVIGVVLLSLALLKKLIELQKEAEELRKKLEEQKKYAMIGTTVGFISHQWRQPMSRMGSVLMYLQSEAELHPDKRVASFVPFLDKLDESVNFINQTIIDIQNLFKAGDDHNRWFSLHDAIQSALLQCEDALSSYRITVEQKGSLSHILHGDPDLLAQSIYNLLQNAIEAFMQRSPQKREIMIVAEKQNETLQLIIEDTAGGIAQQPPQIIFELYETDKKNSSGLGLLIVRKIIEIKFGGSVQVDNSTLGARFILTFPLKSS